MFHNYFFLKRLSKSLHDKLSGLSLLECFSQNKNELLLAFADENKEVWLRANLDPQISLIQVTEDFKRAKKNSVDLFSDLLDLSVKRVRVFNYERSFSILFEQDYQLVFKMHGSRSNLILIHREKTLRVFRSQLPNDLKININELDQAPQIDFNRFQSVPGQPSAFLPALGKEVKKHLSAKRYEDKDLSAQWAEMQSVLNLLEHNPLYLFEENDIPKLSLLEPSVKPFLETTDPILAANTLYEKYTYAYYLGSEKLKAIRSLENQIRKTQNYISKSTEKLNGVKNRRSYEELANIIMANLHQINTGTKKTTLFDFYKDQEIEIKLNPDLSPQKNAENLYRKSKNQKIETDKLQENINRRQAHLQTLQKELEEVRATNDFKTLRKKFNPKEQKKEEAPVPYHHHTYGGYDILIGKNAKANDQLTLKIASKEDYWLHARDVAGSHVVIRHQAGKNLPKEVLERGAQLAAWFSKRKTDTLCPVIHTRKKFIRKAKGSPPGLVIVEKEEVILVEPIGF